ncbi:MAG TPA: hypothetical protein VGC63_04725 [Solirubrobacterales bacterium]|jgi:hypothetical protein
MSDCTLCHDVGWVFDMRTDKPDPQVLEMIACPVPGCEASERPIQNINFKGIRFTHVSLHPRERWVMSLSGGAEGGDG